MTSLAVRGEPRRAHWYTFGVVLFYEFVCGVDRGQVSVLVKPIEQTYGIGDTAFAAVAVSSMFLGAAFVYYLGGILADTFNRRNLLIISGLLWSLSAAAVVFAAHPWQLFATRFVGGFAMSIGGASIFHLLVDSFSRERRLIAMSLFGVGYSLGLGAGLALGGVFLNLADTIGPQTWAVVGSVAPWQLCFLFIAALGVISCLFLVSLKEPSRLDSTVEIRSVSGSLRTFVTYMRQHGRFWVLFLSANFVIYSETIAILNWQPTMVFRVFHVSIGSAAAVLGTLSAITSIAGRLIGGSLSQALLNRGRGDVLPLLFPYVSGASIVFVIIFPLLPTYLASLAVMIVSMLLLATLDAFQVNAIQDTTPNEVRGQIVGIIGLFGFASSAIGGVGVAFVSDHFFGGGAGLRGAFALLGGICAIGATALLAASVRSYRTARSDLERAVSRVDYAPKERCNG